MKTENDVKCISAFGDCDLCGYYGQKVSIQQVGSQQVEIDEVDLCIMCLQKAFAVVESEHLVVDSDRLEGERRGIR